MVTAGHGRSRRRLLAAGGLGALIACLALVSPGGSGVPTRDQGARDASVPSRAARDPAVHAGGGHPAVMPPIDDRIAAIVNERGIPAEARERLGALGGDLIALRERERAAIGADELQREAVDEERRALSAETREVLESLPPAYRAALRRARVSPRQLAVWAMEHP
jgi:hypothetical protein